ncbi:glutamate--cysteine ligase [Siccirubricoccus deserti]|uniref:Glutamate--cysteine ligase n=1 Tax=Siccirubricoccus deserti TaxID=2013562 RepID=A0A9X0QZV4_9PROT|nr:glutamate--cysteine ligase [Siccirubricoccus deserti]MBC4015707.1 glutamate--cysteine ligase [Siccirubricoccus deserti]GGC43984.1 glutamate--cysteine ligase [Siccirubricoccus deserti]
MSNPGEADLTPITDARQLAEWFAAGSKPRGAWGVGTEHEKFGFFRDGFATPPYTGTGGIRALLEGLQARGWAPILDSGNPIGLKRGGASISLEPAGQFELSGAILPDLHATWRELGEHLREVHEITGPMGVGFASLGFHPLHSRDQMPWMPKGRYAIMRRYMPTVGSLGLDMMTRTCTVQANLDYGDEADMVEKLRISLALQPVATALFANSPFTEGRPNGFRSMRAQVWTDTDNARTGIPAVVFEPGFGFERFAEWLLDVPMYFVMRDGKWLDAAGKSFRAFLDGRLDVLPGERATMGDFADHVTTAFTDVRLKRFLEMRGSDVGSAAMITAQPALWVGLLYDDAAQKAAAALVRDWTVEEMRTLRSAVPRDALQARIRGRSVQDVARDVLAIARDGLKARGLGEEVYLAPLDEIVASGLTQADRLLHLYERAWGGDAGRALLHAEV